MRQIADRLHKLLIPEIPDFIQQNRKDDRHRESEDQVVEVQEDRIDDDPSAVHVSEELQEVLEPDPGTAQNPRADLIILEGDDYAVHGDIMEDNIVDQSRQQKKLQILGPVQTLQQIPPRTLFTLGRRRYSYIGHRITFFLSETFLLTGAIAVISSLLGSQYIGDAKAFHIILNRKHDACAVRVGRNRIGKGRESSSVMIAPLFYSCVIMRV